MHGLHALRDTVGHRTDEKDKEPTELTGDNCAVGIVGPDENGEVRFCIITGEELQAYVRYKNNQGVISKF